MTRFRLTRKIGRVPVAAAAGALAIALLAAQALGLIHRIEHPVLPFVATPLAASHAGTQAEHDCSALDAAAFASAVPVAAGLPANRASAARAGRARPPRRFSRRSRPPFRSRAPPTTAATRP